jgi:hypothetical protein
MSKTQENLNRQAKAIVRNYSDLPEVFNEQVKDIGATVERKNGSYIFTNDEGMTAIIPANGTSHSTAPPNWREQARQTALDGVIADVDALKVTKRELLMGTIIARKKLTVIGASGGLGKSTFCIALALAAAAGRSMFNVDCHEGPLRVSAFSTEDELAEVQRLVKASSSLNGFHTSDVNDRLSVFGQEQFPEWFSLIKTDEKTRQPDIDQASIDWINEVLAVNGVDILMLDPLFGLSGGHELSPQMMNLIAIQLKRIAATHNCAVVLIHHTRKANSGSQTSADDLSGGKPLVNASRSTLVVRELTQQEREQWALTDQDMNQIRCVMDVKGNLGPRGWRAFYKLESVTLYDNADKSSFDIQAAKPWYPPSVIRGLTDYIWRHVVERIDAEEFVLFSDRANASGKTPRLTGIVQTACQAATDADGLLYDAKKIENEIRKLKLVVGKDEKNPNSKSRGPTSRAVITPAGRTFLND